MKRIANIILIWVLMSVIYFEHSQAQNILKDYEIKQTKKVTKTLDILSMDGAKDKVKIIPDYPNHILNIICKQNKISISEFWGVPPEIRLLKKSFIEIKYAVRGGSGVGSGNILILCVRNHKVFEALHIIAYNNSVVEDLKTNYEVKLTLTGNAISNYKLAARVQDNSISKQGAETNYIYNVLTTLNFDTKLNTFYSFKEELYNIYTINANQVKNKVSGNFPVIALGKETYYLVNEKWFRSQKITDFHEFQ